MTAESLFSITNPVAAVGWVLLVVAPRHRWAAVAAGRVIPLLLSGVYLCLLVLHWSEGRGGFSSLQGVADLFSNPWLLLAGWVHYLAFDLIIGAWESSDAATRGVSRWLVVPCLALTFLFGPIGWLAYAIARMTGTRTLSPTTTVA